MQQPTTDGHSGKADLWRLWPPETAHRAVPPTRGVLRRDENAHGPAFRPVRMTEGAGLVDAQGGGHGLHHGSLRVVVFQCPDEAAAETAQVDIDHLESGREWIVVGVERVGGRIVEP